MFHHLDPLTVRAAFPDAAEVFLATVSEVQPDQWDQPGLGEWTVRELTGTRCAPSGRCSGCATPPAENPAVDERAGLLPRGVGGARRACRRGRAGPGGRARLVDPVATARMTAEQAIARLAATPDEHVGETFVGPMRLADYLPTRVVELGLHTLDLQAATGQPLALPASATNVMLGVLAELADLPVLLLAMTGRRALPAGFNVIA